jgi:hypothetical protein
VEVGTKLKYERYEFCRHVGASTTIIVEHQQTKRKRKETRNKLEKVLNEKKKEDPRPVQAAPLLSKKIGL